MWLIEPEVFQDDSDPFIEALDSLGVEYDLCQFGTPYESYINKYANRCDVIFHGSLQFGKLLQKNNSSIKVFCNLPQYECTYYYPRFGSHLLNSEYVMLPYGDLNRRKDWLLNKIGNGSVFIRPSSGYKSFTGTVVDAKSWSSLRYIGAKLDPEDIVVVAPSAEVDKEWRVVIVDDKIAGVSQYKNNFEVVRIPGAPDAVITYAQDILKSVDYSPDLAWTLDICEDSHDQLNVLEVGSFSCAGFYAADPYEIIKASYAL